MTINKNNDKDTKETIYKFLNHLHILTPIEIYNVDNKLIISDTVGGTIGKLSVARDLIKHTNKEEAEKMLKDTTTNLSDYNIAELVDLSNYKDFVLYTEFKQVTSLKPDSFKPVFIIRTLLPSTYFSDNYIETKNDSLETFIIENHIEPKNIFNEIRSIYDVDKCKYLNLHQKNILDAYKNATVLSAKQINTTLFDIILKKGK